VRKSGSFRRKEWWWKRDEWFPRGAFALYRRQTDRRDRHGFPILSTAVIFRRQFSTLSKSFLMNFSKKFSLHNAWLAEDSTVYMPLSGGTGRTIVELPRKGMIITQAIHSATQTFSLTTDGAWKNITAP
jgi:hypothetical protein